MPFPGIHALSLLWEDVDGRVKPGHDGIIDAIYAAREIQSSRRTAGRRVWDADHLLQQADTAFRQGVLPIMDADSSRRTLACANTWVIPPMSFSPS